MKLSSLAFTVHDRARDFLFPQWNELRPVATSYAAMAALPLSLLGYLLLLNQHALEWAELAPTFRFFWPGTPWRLVATYYGLVVLALGALVFRLRCPSGVRASKDVLEYSETMKSAVTPTPERARLFVQEISHLMARHRDSLSDLPDFQTMDRLKDEGIYSSHRVKTMVEAGASLQWIIETNSAPLSRCACRILLTTGIAILAIPAIATFVEVTIWVMVKPIFGSLGALR